MVFKKCFAPSCDNSSEVTPKKLFITMPRNWDTKEKWCKALRIKEVPTTQRYFCEDHFNLEQDAENWTYFKNIGSRIKIRPDVLPRIVTPTERNPSHSQLSPSTKKRKETLLQVLEEPAEASCKWNFSSDMSEEGTFLFKEEKCVPEREVSENVSFNGVWKEEKYSDSVSEEYESSSSSSKEIMGSEEAENGLQMNKEKPICSKESVCISKRRAHKAASNKKDPESNQFTQSIILNSLNGADRLSDIINNHSSNARDSLKLCYYYQPGTSDGSPMLIQPVQNLNKENTTTKKTCPSSPTKVQLSTLLIKDRQNEAIHSPPLANNNLPILSIRDRRNEAIKWPAHQIISALVDKLKSHLKNDYESFVIGQSEFKNHMEPVVNELFFQVLDAVYNDDTTEVKQEHLVDLLNIKGEQLDSDLTTNPIKSEPAEFQHLSPGSSSSDSLSNFRD